MLQKTFGYTEEQALEMDGAKSWAEYHWALMNEASVLGNTLKIVGDGYVAQERKRLIAIKKASVGIPTKPKK